MAKEPVSEAHVIRPIGDKILVQVQEAVKQIGGILLPDQAQEKPRKGKVIATGPGKMNDRGEHLPMHVKKGDTVVFANWAGQEDKDSLGEGLKILHENDVLAIIE